MRPKQGMEPCQKKAQKTKLHSTRPRKNGYSQLRQQKEPEEKEFVVYSGASMHMVCKRDLNSAELETMRTSRSPTTVMTANVEVYTREEATVYVRELDLFFCSSFSREALRESGVCLPLDQRSETTSHQKKAKGFTAIYQTVCRSLSLVYLRVPLQRPHLFRHHLHHGIPYLTSTNTPKIQYKKEVEVRVRSYGETRCINPQKPKTIIKMKDAKEYTAIYRMIKFRPISNRIPEYHHFEEQ